MAVTKLTENREVVIRMGTTELFFFKRQKIEGVGEANVLKLYME